MSGIGGLAYIEDADYPLTGGDDDRVAAAACGAGLVSVTAVDCASHLLEVLMTAAQARWLRIRLVDYLGSTAHPVAEPPPTGPWTRMGAVDARGADRPFDLFPASRHGSGVRDPAFGLLWTIDAPPGEGAAGAPVGLSNLRARELASQLGRAVACLPPA